MRIALAALPLFLVAGCAHQPKVATAPRADPYAQSHGSSAAGNGATAAAATACSTDVDCGAKQLCLDRRCVDITANMAECGRVSVQFGFNSSIIEPDARESLQRSARCLNADQALHVTIEGNADERGTDEYNLALGDTRAASVARYLGALGVSSRQLATVSYGKERPLCVEHNEACWAKNRRVDLARR